MEDQDIVKIDNDMSIIYEVVKDALHDGLECGRCVTKAESHDEGFKKTKFGFKCCFPFVTIADTDIVVAPTDVKLREVARAA